MSNLNTILRDGRDVDMPALRQFLADQNARVNAANLAISTGTVAAAVDDRLYATQAELFADLVPAADEFALVYADSDYAKNGLYQKTGATTTGSWEGPFDLFSSAAEALVQPLADAAAESAADAEAAATQAEAFADSAEDDAVLTEAAKALALAAATSAGTSAELAAAALLSSGLTYPNTSAGLAATAEGGYFWTEALGFYREQSGMAVLKELLLTASRLGMTTPEMAGAVGDGTTDDRAALNTANALAKVLLINKPHFVGSDLTLGRVMFGPEGLLIPHAGATITIGEIVNSETRDQLFDPVDGGAIKLRQSTARPDWWGEDAPVQTAIDALPDAGGMVMLGVRNYRESGHSYSAGVTADAVYQDKANIHICGEKKPVLSSDCSSLIYGSVIEGQWLAFADGIQYTNVGFDSGKDVIDTYAGGTPTAGRWEGLINTFASQEQKNANALRRGLKMRGVVCLGYSPTAEIHACIAAEGYTDVDIDDVTVCMNGHGFALKASNVRVSRVTAMCNGLEGVIIKSDTQDTAIASDIQIDTIAAYANAPGYSPHSVATTGAGVMINASTNDVSGLQIGKIISRGHPRGFDTFFGSGSRVLESFSIGEIITDDNSQAGVYLVGAGANSQTLRSSIGRIHARNTPVGVFCNTQGGGSLVHVGAIQAVNCTDVAMDVVSGPGILCDYIEADNCDVAALRLRAGARPLLGKIVLLNGTPAKYASSGSGTVPALATGWSQVSGNDPWGVDYCDGQIVLRGLIAAGGGATNTVMTLPPWARPATNKRGVVQGSASGGGAQSAVPIVVATNGDVIINEIAGGTSNAAQWLSLNFSYSLVD